jgi:hypothetical protein
MGTLPPALAVLGLTRCKAAFRERVKIHDIVLEGIELALRKRAKK